MATVIFGRTLGTLYRNHNRARAAHYIEFVASTKMRQRVVHAFARSPKDGTTEGEENRP